MRVPNSHICLTSTHLISQFCKPLYEHTLVNCFEFDRYYFDGFGFNTNSGEPGLISSYTKDDLYPSLIELDSYYNASELAFITTDFLQNDSIVDAQRWKKNIEIAQEFKLNERFYLMSKKQHYYNVYGFFITELNQYSLPYHLEHVNFYKKFITYFESAAAELLSDCHKTRLKFCSRYLLGYDEAQKQKSEIENLIKQTKSSQPLMLDNIRITPTEERCLQLLTLGYSAKESAIQLNISPRTVEQHIFNLKQKFNCNKMHPIIRRYILEKRDELE